MTQDILMAIASAQKVSFEHAKAVLELIEGGATVPFIARYRKEVTGGMDENQIREIYKEYEYECSLKERKEDVIRLIEEKGLLTDEIRQKINEASKLVEVEDLYRPFKEKKLTKATAAISMGLEPLSKIMMSFPQNGNKEEIVSKYINDKVESYDAAIENAKYIIAEWISDNAYYRKAIRNNMFKLGFITSKIKKDAEDIEEIYKNYYDYREAVSSIKDHRILALNRGEKEKVLNVGIEGNKEVDINYLNAKIIKKPNSLFEVEIKKAIVDAYKRLIAPSIEREVRGELTKKAEEGAIDVFSLNLKNLLLQAPIKGKVVLGVDPAFRTGCKLAVISESGAVLDKGVIFPNERAKGATVNENLLQKSKDTLSSLVKKYNVNIIAIGNGTASRETEEFVASTIKEYHLDVKYAIVSEAGASVYSASKIAQDEFPNFHVEERSAVSIARRLQDPLSELVKIDPKSIGVGQYQHDVDQHKLSESLDNIVIDAVNKVGVDLNTASVSLLSYVSGITNTIAKNIVDYRNRSGKFNDRKELLNVSKLGPKAYEQCVGFTRIIDGKNELDRTSIHPESYDKTLKIMKILDIKHLGDQENKEIILKANKKNLMKEVDIDSYTLDDVLDAIIAPEREVRGEYPQASLRGDIRRFEDLHLGDELEGTVRNVVDFGAFVDCGVKYDGLVHISKISKNYIKHPKEVLNVGDIIHVYVIGIDLDRHKLSLSMFKE